MFGNWTVCGGHCGKLSTILRVVGDMTQFVPLESRDLNSKNQILDKEMLLIFS